jgi:DeoR family transcriptional regulator, fructose operon transcriptional repressor
MRDNIMFAAERIRLIKKILLEKKKADVASLSNILRVSEVTIRRDLEKLDDENFLVRTHGGAILNEEILNSDNSHFESIIDTHFSEKSLIGQIASYMVNDNDTIILGPGSTCQHIARHIRNKKNIKVVTTDINIATELLSDASNIRVVLVGGEVDPSSLQLSGSITEQILSNIFVNRAFIEVDGIHLTKGYSTESMEKASVIRKIMSVSRDVVAVSDYSKFNNPSFCYLGDITTFTKVISNEQTPENFKNFFFEHNIQLITTFNVYEERY